MDGPMRPYLPELTIRDYNIYQWYLRGVQYQLNTTYGLYSCSLLQHNGVLFALLSDSLAGREATCKKVRLPWTLCWRPMMCQTQGIRLAAQVEEYNEMCEAGVGKTCEKDGHYMQPIAKAPFYCCRQNVGAYGSLGGVKINHRTQAMTQEAKVIPGLYCVGTDACNIFGDSYPFILAGNTMGFCLNSGRIAGENAAAELDGFEY